MTKTYTGDDYPTLLDYWQHHDSIIFRDHNEHERRALRDFHDRNWEWWRTAPTKQRDKVKAVMRDGQSLHSAMGIVRFGIR